MFVCFFYNFVFRIFFGKKILQFDWVESTQEFKPHVQGTFAALRGIHRAEGWEWTEIDDAGAECGVFEGETNTL